MRSDDPGPVSRRVSRSLVADKPTCLSREGLNVRCGISHPRADECGLTRYEANNATMLFTRWILTVCAWSIVTIPSLKAGCPAYIEKSELKAAGIDADPTSLSFFSYDKARGWQRQPFQVIGLSDDGLMDMTSNESPKAEELDNFRLAFDPGIFADEAPRGARPPCAFRRKFFIRQNATPDRFVYAFRCNNAREATASFAKPFRFDGSQRMVEGPTYGYSYNKRNNIMFDDIWLNDGGERVSVARKSTLNIRADIKRFFTLTFGVDDIESRIKHQYEGPVAFVSTLDFFLTILFFKINLELNTSLSFFSDAVNVPMILHMPVDASRWVYPGSGIFYAWESRDDLVRYDLGASRIPAFDAALIKQGYDKVGDKGVANCLGELCTFTLVLRVKERPVVMQFRMARYLVERGFYPVFVDDLRAAEKALGWSLSGKANAGWRQAAVYFENSGTQAGEHKWDFWLDIEGKENMDVSHCPVRGYDLVKVH